MSDSGKWFTVGGASLIAAFMIIGAGQGVINSSSQEAAVSTSFSSSHSTSGTTLSQNTVDFDAKMLALQKDLRALGVTRNQSNAMIAVTNAQAEEAFLESIAARLQLKVTPPTNNRTASIFADLRLQLDNAKIQIGLANNTMLTMKSPSSATYKQLQQQLTDTIGFMTNARADITKLIAILGSR